MSTHQFEHPLNEKTRIYLRVESLLSQAQLASSFAGEHQYRLFFRAIFDLMEIFEQIQLKSELAKDLEKQRLNYRRWLNVDGVDENALLNLLSEIDQTHSQLMKAERFGQTLKQDSFLSSIRQRFNLPGGSCCFDLPALHYWEHLPLIERRQDAAKWLTSLQSLIDSINLWLKLTRDTGYFKPQHANKGFFQSYAEDANILRLEIPNGLNVYPMISGHKNRFVIKFIYFENGQPTTDDINFKLAVCN